MVVKAAIQAPSPACLRALRLIAFPGSVSLCAARARRQYAALPETKSPPPPLNRQPPPAVFRPSPSGSDLRKKRDDDDDLTPYPLARPIGMPQPPQPGENMGLDNRTLRQRRDDFHNYEKHLEKRSKLTKQISKPYFRDWSNMRFHKGKVFLANERLFRAEHALFFPNFYGRTLRRGVEKRDAKDGYSGFGRDSCSVMQGKISVVSIVSNQWAEGQVNTFCSKTANPELHTLLQESHDIAQRVEINLEMNTLKWYLLQMFAARTLRKSRTLEEQERYFMVRRGVDEIVKEAIGLLNDKGGYVYLVDQECRLRWGGSAEALPVEIESMVRGLRRLIQEARTPPDEREMAAQQQKQLDSAVADITL